MPQRKNQKDLLMENSYSKILEMSNSLLISEKKIDMSVGKYKEITHVSKIYQTALSAIWKITLSSVKHAKMDIYPLKMESNVEQKICAHWDNSLMRRQKSVK